MKCPNCGAEVAGNFCEYCGSQLQGQRPKCSKCGSTNITFKRENQGEIRGKSSKQVIHRTVGLCKDCGNTWYVSETAPSITPHKRKTWLWVLGWLFIFPLPLTVLIMRKKDMNAILKILAIAASWIIYLSIGMAREKQENQILNAADLSPAPIQVINTNTPNSVEGTDNTLSGETDEVLYAEDDVVNKFITDYNSITSSPITDIKKGNIRTKYFFTTYGFNVEIINATKAAAGYTTVSINGNMAAHVPEMRDVFHDIVKTFEPNLTDEQIYTFFDERTVEGNCAKDTPLGTVVCSVFLTGNASGNGRIDIHN